MLWSKVDRGRSPEEWSAAGPDRYQVPTSKLNSTGLFARKWSRAPATIDDEGLADAAAANPFRLPRNHPGMSSSVPLRRAAQASSRPS